MRKIKIACLQLQAHDLADAEIALERAVALIDAAGQDHPDLLILPECTYPAYYLESVESYHRAKLRPQDQVVRLLREHARAHHAYMVVGIAQPVESGRLLNTAYVFDPQGAVVGTYAKSFLWHFDQTWFDPGSDYPTFDLGIGRTGVFVCADGRMPEIARILGVEGSRLMVDSTAWVTSGGDRATLSNPQFEYMIPTRAIENGAWIAVANKVGVEAESIVYCGRSCIVSPQGKIVAQGSPANEECVTAEVDLDAPRSETNQGDAAAVPTRRPECYQLLGEPTEALPVSALLIEPIVPATSTMRLGAVQLKPYFAADAWLARASTLTETLVRQGASLILLPGVPVTHLDQPAYQAANVLDPLLALSQRLACGLACPMVTRETDGKRRHSMYLLSKGQVIARYDQTHLPSGWAGDWQAGESLAVANTPYGRIGMMLGDEGLLPEVARVLMLQGADLILWPSATSRFPLRMIARTRADENRVFVALATPLQDDAAPQTALVNPAGALVAAALPDIEQAIAGQIAWALARYKEMAPNTNVVLNRQPSTYRRLAR